MGQYAAYHNLIKGTAFSIISVLSKSRFYFTLSFLFHSFNYTKAFHYMLDMLLNVLLVLSTFLFLTNSHSFLEMICKELYKSLN